MGTRAAFWVGHPSNLDSREWLGCIAWDGYPGGLPGLEDVVTEAGFREYVDNLTERDDFASPKGGWPYPWTGNIYLTDYNYAFFDNAVQVTCFREGWCALCDYDPNYEGKDTLPGDVPAPSDWDQSQPDSIMIFGVPNA